MTSPGNGAPPPGGTFPWLLAWVAATAGGLVMFFGLSRRTLDTEPVVILPTDEGSTSTTTPAGEGRQPDRARRLTGDEAHLPRWLRPSVQAARYNTPGRTSAED